MGIRERLKESGRSLLSRGRQDVRRGREAARRRAPSKEELTQAARDRAREVDDGNAMFGAAEESSEMEAPVDASLDPLSAPEETEKVARGATGSEGSEPAVDDLVTGFGGSSESEESEESDPLFSFGGSSEESGDGLLDFGGER